MANDVANRSFRIRRLLQLSDELRQLSDLVRRRARGGSRMSTDLLARNRELVRRCDELASEMSGH